ncbi:hypothetical protein D5F11_011495 [Siminovitchia terrae]|uniref:Uncharacterized protein n=1 Tax=Siminovitchia terrae TaxID=1914933 RepID=A0A429X8L0_SIMTE|nr:hypothetical protein [Siminovitchia terrae]RST59719.1 hypothetical protein D5F11_011495 [Siminovitchia terrae]
MQLEITRRNENIVNGEVESVQVHYKLSSDDYRSMHNGFIETDRIDASIPELKEIVKETLAEQISQIAE